MTEVLHFEPGNYDFVHAPGGPFSAGVAPMNGYALRRVRFGRPIPMAEGFALIEAYLGRKGRPLTALAACELRSPAAMTMAEFQTFNRQYLQTLHAWGCRLGEINTMARSNIAPITEVPNESSFFAFTYTVPERDAAGDFLISGKPENRDGVTGPERIFGGRDVSLRGLEAKARFVVNALRERVMALNCDWSGITAAQIYTVHDIRPLLENILAEARLSQIGIAWYPAWPPVLGLEFEADVRRVRMEIVV
jgi:hypothetical protein